MVRRSVAIIWCLMATGCAPTAALPERFYGDWGLTGDDCDDVESQTGLTITVDRLQFYEAAAEILAVRVLEDQEVDASLSWSNTSDVDMENPGHIPPPIVLPAKLRLMDDGAQLAFSMNDETRVYVRCG